MQQTLRKISQTDPAFRATETELLQSTARSLVYTVAVFALLGLLATAIWPAQVGDGLWLSMPVILLTCVLTERLLRSHFVLSQIVWQVGLAIAAGLAVYVFRLPAIALALILLPLMAASTLGWQGALLSEVLIVALAAILARGPLTVLPDAYVWAILCGGIVTSVIGWSSGRALLTASAWSLYSVEQARASLAETRERRSELARVLRDLDRAYYSLDRANNMLVLARAEAEEARDARNRLALAISHELRTPLNFIIGFSELMVNSPQTYGPLETWPPGLYEDVQEIHRSSSHLQRLVNDVLALGQIDSLQMTLFKQWSDPLHIVRDVEKMVQPAFARKKLAFQIQAQMHLPQIYVDSTRIRQVLLNLVSNSLRVTERGGVTIHVRCVGEEVEFCVQDTGPGIAAQDLPKIFQEFVQAGKDSWRRHEGVGLGLPISKRLIELHGGQMRVESTAGEGSCFYFTVPLREAQFARRDATGMTSDTAYWKHLKRKAQDERIVLALSPDPAAGDVIAHYTDGSGIVAVQNIDLLGSAVNELLPSALLVDQGMILNEEDEKALASLPFDLPVVRFAFPGSPQRPGPLPDGVAGYLVKPVERASLLQAIESLGVNIARLLVVDDDPGMVRFVKRTLRSAELSDAPGPPVLATALSGTEALQQVRHNRPDAVLLDLALPDMSGWDVLKDLQARAIPAILMTAYDYPQMLKSEVRDALRVTMRRPLAREELRSVLSCLLKTVRPVYPRLTGAAKRQASRAE